MHKPGALTRTDRTRPTGPTEGDSVTETGDQFAGTSERSTKHSPRVDEELEHEIQGMLKGEHATRAEEWREVEPVAEGDPDVDADPAGHAGRRDAGRHDRRRRRRPGRAGPLAGPGGLPEHRRRAGRGRPRPPGARRRRRRARESCPTARPTSGSATSSARWATRPRPDRRRPLRAAGSGPLGALPGLFLRDLLRPAAAEQPRAGEALHDLPHVLHGVDQVVDVGADRPEGLQDRQDVLVQVRDQLRQPVDEGDQRLDLVRVERRRPAGGPTARASVSAGS